jgi:SAM-dependent methyltransferase
MVRLPRQQLFEFNDLHQAPAPVRDLVVESLSRTLSWGRMLDGLVEPFARFLDEAGTREVLDIGAGAGGPARILSRALQRGGRPRVRFVLTDLHPRVEAWSKAAAEMPDAIAFERSPVDATDVPRRLSAGRARTIINVLHHFPPELATAVLRDAVKSGQGIFVSEAFDRNPLAFARFAPAGLPALLATPLLTERDRLAKMALTWLTPAALGIAIWDGVVSTLRIYDEQDLREMVAPFGGGYRWEFGRYPYFPGGKGYYFYGVPRG